MLAQQKAAAEKLESEQKAESGSDDSPADEAPTAEKPADIAPADEAPAAEKPADEAPADEAPAAEKPADESPAVEAPKQVAEEGETSDAANNEDEATGDAVAEAKSA
jgi:hypothetical protein